MDNLLRSLPPAAFSWEVIVAAPWTVTCQAPLSMGLPRQECWSGLPFPPPEDLLDPDIKSVSSGLGRRILNR